MLCPEGLFPGCDRSIIVIRPTALRQDEGSDQLIACLLELLLLDRDGVDLRIALHPEVVDLLRPFLREPATFREGEIASLLQKGMPQANASLEGDSILIGRVEMGGA